MSDITLPHYIQHTTDLTLYIEGDVLNPTDDLFQASILVRDCKCLQFSFSPHPSCCLPVSPTLRMLHDRPYCINWGWWFWACQWQPIHSPPPTPLPSVHTVQGGLSLFVTPHNSLNPPNTWQAPHDLKWRWYPSASLPVSCRLHA